jgi:predicted nucleic acid-binding protein
MLDTNIVSGLIRNPAGRAAQRARAAAEPVCVSVIVAACALAATVVTANVGEFRHIRGLNVENRLE